MDNELEKPISCGLVMPISAIEDCTTDHWLEVKDILIDSLKLIPDFSFKVDLVSNADDTGVIQRRIVQNLYNCDIIVCNVSAKNPNVMFELGMRLAFDKPTVIVKDDKTNYSFDTAVIEHLTYPRDLRFAAINRFKQALSQKVKSTYISGKDSNNSVFLKNFGTFHVAKIANETITPNEAILKNLIDLQSEVFNLRRSISSSGIGRISAKATNMEHDVESVSTKLNFILNNLRFYKEITPERSSNDLINDVSVIETLYKSQEAKNLFRDKADYLELFEFVKRHVMANGL